MKFNSREDIEVPIDVVYSQLSDFVAFERRALRHGVQVTWQNADPSMPAQAGTKWQINLKFRGRNRSLVAELVRLDPPNGYQIEAASDGMNITTDVELIALSRTRTRVMVGMDLRARSLTARLVLQSMKLAKSKLAKRFRVRVLEFTEDIEDDYRKRR